MDREEFADKVTDLIANALHQSTLESLGLIVKVQAVLNCPLDELVDKYCELLKAECKDFQKFCDEKEAEDIEVE